MEPLRLNSPLKDYIWGGTRLKQNLEKAPDWKGLRKAGNSLATRTVPV